ncbi:hypothetical protein FB45DRAFT_998903 [Roridomyces roridus]|uniref:phytol kinase n=1 Tax=Roridomyces roridus TaxID=1738132 RepID=A0AAD7G174_9AGAR|nr:hypothetical protein FB45DRAFT_998903 [Roridomyces roridus]
MAQNTQYRDILRKVRAAPKRFISAARHQNPQGLAALTDLAKVWTHVPRMMEQGIIDMFLSHLREELAPSSTREWHDDVEFAQLSLRALTEMDKLFNDPRYDTQTRAFVAGWPGMVKWSEYIYDVRQQAASSVKERIAYLIEIVPLFLRFSQVSTFLPTMWDTPGTVELFTKLWIRESEGVGKLEGAIMNTIDMILRHCAAQGRMDAHDMILTAVAGDADSFVQLVLRRMRKVTKRLDKNLEKSGTIAGYINILMALCYPDTHPFRRAVFDAGAIPSVTRIFVALSRTISSNSPEIQVVLLASCIPFVLGYLEWDGYTGVVRAMKMGVLQALLDGSPVFPRMPKEIVDAALECVRDMLPPYAVYRSFVDAVAPFLKDREQEKVSALPAALTPFWSKLAERVHVLGQTDDEVTRCDNFQCQHLDTTFKICGGCQVVCYCSRECQKADWKQGHRSVCEFIKVDTPLGHRDRIDQSRIQTLAQKIVHLNSATFHAIADRDFPDTPRNELVPCIDLSRVPEVLSVRTFDEAIGGRIRPTADWYRSHGITSVLCLRKDGSQFREMWLPAASENFWEV